MDDLDSELTPNIEWMLESGQANPELLADALARAYFQPVYRFGLAYLDGERLAEQVAVESLSAALLNAYNFRGGSVEAWLFQFVVENCRKKRSRAGLVQPFRNKLTAQSENKSSRPIEPDTASRQGLRAAVGQASRKYFPTFLFTYLLSWSPEQVSQVLRVGPKEIAAQLEVMRPALIEIVGAGSELPGVHEADQIDGQIRQRTERLWPEIELGTEALADIVQAVLSAAEHRRNKHYQVVSLKELLLVAIVIALASGLIYSSNILFPEPSPTQPPVQTVLVTRLAQIVVTSTPVPPAPPTVTPTSLPALADTFQPLTLVSSSAAVRNGISFSHYSYQTLWVDALLQFYGPEGFAGAPQAYRVQIWLDKTIPAGVLLGGEPDFWAEEVGLIRSEVGYWSELDGLPPFKVRKISVQQSLRSWYAANLALYQPYALGDLGTFRITGREELLGRESIIADYINLAGQLEATLWLDAQTGLVLRQRYYAPSQNDLYYDIRLLDLAIDPDIPGDLFNPEYQWTGAFAKNVTNQAFGQAKPPLGFYLNAQAEMKSLPFAAAPQGFDPGNSQLYFQISQLIAGSSPEEPLSVQYQASIFTDEYFLGNLDFEHPWNLICDRSPDGTRMAIATLAGENRSLLRLYDLKLALPTEARAFSAAVTEFSFAPNSRRLAVFVSHEPVGSVHIIDTDTHRMTHLIDIPDARSLVWSPDGEYLAMIGRVTEPLAGDDVIVVRVRDGLITYRKSVDYQTGNLGDWPPLEWGVEFPVEMDRLAQCALPPGGALDR